MYADDSYALVYLCHEVENDGTCSPDHVELEAFSRSPTKRPSEAVMATIVETLQNACFEISDFEKLDHTGELDIPLLKHGNEFNIFIFS